jgi:XTP/dITP diphosphohydrolase
MILTLIAATRNKHKLKEISKLMRGTGIRLRSLDDYPPIPDVVENGRTLEANAIKKAEAVSKAFGQPALSDDSGLFVPALQGKPGVRSARYAGPECNYAANNVKLLKAMKSLSGSKRKAYFATTMALAWPGEKTVIRTGTLSGKIITENRGRNGFGYDPVFVPAGYGKTLAEMTPKQKNQISHRSRALAKVAVYLRNTLEKKRVKG